VTMTVNRARLLVTGFGPFPGIPHNPSAEIARRVAGSPRWRTHEVAAQALILPTTYAALDEVLEPALAREAPDALLMIGVAGRARRVRIERRALNRASILSPDAGGWRPDRLTLRDGHSARSLRKHPVPLRAAMHRHGIACSISQNAGRYLCNAAYYRALATPIPVLFVHIPKGQAWSRPRTSAKRRLSWQDCLASALVDVALQLLSASRAERSRPAARI
jgi:pyroglutamyl-peptidase